MAQRRRLLSIILTSRDRFELLNSAVNSVYAQTFRDWELIIADDDSQDKRIHALYETLERDPYVTIMRGQRVPENYRKTHKMNAVRINSAIQLANGRFVTYLSDDNVWLSTRCARLMKVFKKQPGVDVVVDLAQWITWDGQKFPQDRFKYNYQKPFEVGHEKLLKLIAPSNFIVNDCVIQKSPRRCSKCEHWPVDHTHTPVDWRYWLKLLSDGKKFVKLTEVGTVAYFPGTWKTATVKQAMTHRQEPNEREIMNAKLKRRARAIREKREKVKAKSAEDRWCVNTGTSAQQYTDPNTNKFLRVEPGGRVKASQITLPNGGILPGFTYESRHKPKPLKEVLKTKPAEPQDFGFEAVEEVEEVAPVEDEIVVVPEDVIAEEDIKDESNVMPICSKCGKPISPKTKTGLCQKCYRESVKKK